MTPPNNLKTYGRVFWLLNAPRLVKAGRLKMQHLTQWDSLCRRYGAYRRAESTLDRLEATDERYPIVASVAARAYQQYASSAARFGLDPLSDAMVGLRDGSSVDDETPAPKLPAAAAAEDPAERWEREFGRGG